MTIVSYFCVSKWMENKINEKRKTNKKLLKKMQRAEKNANLFDFEQNAYIVQNYHHPKFGKSKK